MRKLVRWLIGIWESGIKGKVGLGCGGLIVLLVACLTCGTLVGSPQETSEPLPTASVLTKTQIPTDSPTSTSSPTPESTPTPERTKAQVIKVIDGDTIDVEIESKVYVVRYIGIDAPETKHPDEPVEWMGPEATAANRQLVGGKTVYLERDVSETDKYDRLLRYVFLADGTFVNAELVRQGYAHVGTYPPDVKYQDLLQEMQQKAREAEWGLWGTIPTPVPPTTTPVPATATPLPASATPVPPTATTAAQPTQPPAVCDCSENIYNCSDFNTHNEAQACFEYCVSLGVGDVHRLDGDNNSTACESLP